MKSRVSIALLIGAFFIFSPKSGHAQLSPQIFRPIPTHYIPLCLQGNPNAVTQVVNAVCDQLSSVFAIPRISLPVGPDLSCAGNFDGNGGNEIWDNLGVNGGFANIFSTAQIRELVGTCKIHVNNDALQRCLTEIASWNWTQVTSHGVSPTNLSNLESLMGTACNGVLSAPDPSQVGCQEFTVHCGGSPDTVFMNQSITMPIRGEMCLASTDLSRTLPTIPFPSCASGHIASFDCTKGCIHPTSLASGSSIPGATLPPVGPKTNCKIATIDCSCTGEAPFQTEYRMNLSSPFGARSIPVDPPPCMSESYIANDLSSGTDDCANSSLAAGATCTVTNWGCNSGMECSTPEY